MGNLLDAWAASGIKVELWGKLRDVVDRVD